jgi:hypothetical protein
MSLKRAPNTTPYVSPGRARGKGEPLGFESDNSAEPGGPPTRLHDCFSFAPRPPCAPTIGDYVLVLFDPLR